ncbi:MAG: hypothetical protein WCE81_11420 [Halobacteriota archaeon]
MTDTVSNISSIISAWLQYAGIRDTGSLATAVIKAIFSMPFPILPPPPPI